ncbi:MAG: hypothetical protein ABIQ39_08215 [Ilumatobacteraceae bacterium]
MRTTRQTKSQAQPSTAGITTGVLGGTWRAVVTGWGAVVPLDGSATLDWHIAADDRWHSPASEPSVRQSRIEGTPVIETRLRIPRGDVVQRIYSVADGGGLTVVEVSNDSPLPIAVAFTGRSVLSARPPTEMPVQGIDLPDERVVFPVGHHTTIAVALAHDGRSAGLLPAGLPPALQVARGWSAMCDRAGRYVVPDEFVLESVVAIRCELALRGPGSPADDPVGFLIGVGLLTRLGENVEPWLADVAAALEQAAKTSRRGGADWSLLAAFDAADQVFAVLDDERAATDLEAMRARFARAAADLCLPSFPPEGVRLVAWLEQLLADSRGRLLPGGLPPAWLGAAVEAYHVPVGTRSKVSFALRWHGARPAVLWEVAGQPVTLTAPLMAPQWTSAAQTGEALWPVPPGALPNTAAPDEPVDQLPADARPDSPVSDSPVSDSPVSDSPVSDSPVSDSPVSDSPAPDSAVQPNPVESGPTARPVADGDVSFS